MYPEINIGPITLQTFGLMFGLGFVVAGLIIARRFRELGKPADWAYEMAFAALVGGLVGSRAYFLIENWGDVSDDLVGNLFSGAGLVWYGGAIGGALAVCRLGLLARDHDPAADRHRRALAGDRLRDRPGRLPALRRRRLRQAMGRAVGDGLSGRDGADRPDRPPDAGLRDALHGAGGDRPLAAPRPVPGRDPLRALSHDRRLRALHDRVPPPQPRLRARPDPGAADERRDDADRWDLDRRDREPRAAAQAGARPLPRAAPSSSGSARRRAGSPCPSGRRPGPSR